MITMNYKGKEYEITFSYEYENTLLIDISGVIGFDLHITDIGHLESYIIEYIEKYAEF